MFAGICLQCLYKTGCATKSSLYITLDSDNRVEISEHDIVHMTIDQSHLSHVNHFVENRVFLNNAVGVHKFNVTWI